jgi:hypothetical protein
MKTAVKIFLIIVLLIPTLSVYSQITYDYYKNPKKIGSTNPKATKNFIRAFEYIMQWGKEDSDSAIFYLQRAIKEDSIYAIAYASLGHMFLYEGYKGTTVDSDSIQNLAKKALAINPQCGDALTLMARILIDKYPDEALEYCRKAVKAEPDHRETWLWLGMMYLPNSIDSAIFAFNKSLEADSLFGQPHQKLGMIYIYYHPDNKKAAFHYRKMVDLYENIAPRDERMIVGYYGLGQSLALDEQWESAIDTLNLLFQKCENTTLLWVDRLKSMAYPYLIYALRGKAEKEYNNLITLSRKRLDEFPDDAKVSVNMLYDYYDLSNLLNKNYDLADSLEKCMSELVHRVVRQSNDENDIINSIYIETYTLLDSKKYDVALNELNSYLKNYSGRKSITAEIFYVLAIVYQKKDDTKKIFKNLEMAINDGFKDYERIKKDFVKLKDISEFNKLCKKIKK